MKKIDNMFKKGDIVKFIDRDGVYQVTDASKDGRYVWVENVITHDRILTSPSKIVKK
jgi:hypothetical protein